MSVYRAIKKFILDILFPVACLSCGQDDIWLCYKCLNQIPLNKDLTCPLCQTKTHGATCRNCSANTYLDGLLIATKYNQEIIQSVIHALKYKFIQEVSAGLSGLINKFLLEFDRHYKPAILKLYSGTIVTAVPLHKKRSLERGFNQSELIAIEIAKQYQFQFQPNLLKRKRYTIPQVLLTKKQREKNLANAFALNQPFKNINKNVIIVDDVATTLTTLNECAKVLKQAGCNKVWGLVIARGG